MDDGELVLDNLQIFQLDRFAYPPTMVYDEYWDDIYRKDGIGIPKKCYGEWVFGVDDNGELTGFVHAVGFAENSGLKLVAQITLVKVDKFKLSPQELIQACGNFM